MTRTILRRRNARFAFLGAAIAVLGCEGRRTITGEAAQFALTVHVSPPASLAAAAQRLGWPASVVPGAEVVVTRSGDNSSGTVVAPDTVITDATGVARFSSLTFGNYAVAASRTLSPAEVSLAGDALTGTVSFIGVLSATLGSVDDQVADVQLSPVDRGSLLFSEIFPSVLGNAARNFIYYYGDYIRIYNNSDTTIALAGKLFSYAMSSSLDYASVNPPNTCATFAPLWQDPAGIWAQLIYRFPSNARVLRPGETALVVTDAIDHRPIGAGDPGYFDFSHADFEFRGGSDVNNPVVPDMISVGPRDGGLGIGHGWSGFLNRPVYVLALPLDIDTLPKQYNAVFDGGSFFVRIPNAALLDVVTEHNTDPESFPPCAPAVLPSIDAAEARLVGYFGTVSMHRKVARTLPSGRAILQWSHNSAADWFAGAMTPFGVP